MRLLLASLLLVAGAVACGDGAEVDLGGDGPVVTERDGSGGAGDAGDGDGGEAGGDGDGGPDAVSLDDTGPVGSMGPALLSDTVPKVLVETDSTDDAGLSPSAFRNLTDALGEHGGKREVSRGAATPEIPRQDVYTADDLRRLARAHRDESSGGDRAVIYVMVLSGAYENSSATGVAFEAGSFAVFPDRLRSGLVQIGSSEQFETAVLLHELGHLFGLVNLTGEGAFHEDPEHAGHSNSRDSVMYWAIEDVSIANVFRGGPPTTFDDADREEMANVRA